MSEGTTSQEKPSVCEDAAQEIAERDEKLDAAHRIEVDEAQADAEQAIAKASLEPGYPYSECSNCNLIVHTTYKHKAQRFCYICYLWIVLGRC